MNHEKIYVKIGDNHKFAGIHEVLNVQDDIIAFEFNGERDNLFFYEIEKWCDKNGNYIRTIAERCLEILQTVNEIDNEFHMFEIVTRKCSKARLELYCKTSDFTFVVTFCEGKNCVWTIDGNDEFVEGEQYEIFGAQAFMNILRLHNVSNAHKKYLSTGYLKKYV